MASLNNKINPGQRCTTLRPGGTFKQQQNIQLSGARRHAQVPPLAARYVPLLAADVQWRRQAAAAGDKAQEAAPVLVGEAAERLPHDLDALVCLLHVLVVRWADTRGKQGLVTEAR